jgi:tripartite-type tricarboxylate transporter receptor subunit TctC
MKLPRRKFLYLAASAAALPFAPHIARAQAYPTRPVRIIVPVPAGGTPDILARLIGQWLSERLGQPFIVENRPGGATNIGTEAVVRASADGYTLLLCVPPNAVNATLYDKLNYSFIRDIAPVAGLIRSPNLMVVNPSVPAKTVPEFIAYAKANPGKTNMASSGKGSSPHLAGELFKLMTGIKMVHVPYRGGARAVADLLAGRVQIYFMTVANGIEYVRAGRLRALAVSTLEHIDVLPDLPTINEFVPGFETSAWFGIGAPRNTPVEVIDKLNKEINAGLANSKIKVRLASLGGTVLALSPADFGKLIAEETEKWGKVIKSAGIKPV